MNVCHDWSIRDPGPHEREGSAVRPRSGRPGGAGRRATALLLTAIGVLALGAPAFGLGACGRGAASAASRPSPASPAGERPSAAATPGAASRVAAVPRGPALIAGPSAPPDIDLPVRVFRLRSWWNVVDHSDRYLAVNRALAGPPTAQDLDGIRDEHYLIDMESGARRRVRRHCVAGPDWWSMARAVSDAGWLAWEEVRGQTEDRWRLYGARFDRTTLRVGKPRLLLHGERRRIDRPHFALFGRRLVGVMNSYGPQSDWGSLGWAFSADLATGERRVLYRAPVSVGDLSVAANGTVAFVEYADPVDVCSVRFVVLRIADGTVVLRHRYAGGPVRKVAWDGRNLAWEGEREDGWGGYWIFVRRRDGVVRRISDAGMAPTLSGGHLFFTDCHTMGVDDRVLAVRLRDWYAGRLPGRGAVSSATACSRRTVVWEDGSGGSTVVRVGRLR